MSAKFSQLIQSLMSYILADSSVYSQQSKLTIKQGKIIKFKLLTGQARDPPQPHNARREKEEADRGLWEK